MRELSSAPNTPPAQPTTGGPGSAVTNDRPTVLMVDDNPENLTVIGELLQGEYQVRAANSGERALALAHLEPTPDLILLDIMMPGMDGREVLTRLRADPDTADIPVIFVTAMAEPEDELWGLKLGAVDYIAKPIRPGAVLARVRTQIELKRHRDRLRNENAWLEAEVARRMRENQEVQAVSIRALAQLADLRDQETGQHLRRTQEYVRILALALRHHPRFASQLDDRKIDTIAKSAPLHDIGKVGIPDHILLKPGRLNEEEWTVMKTHAALGAQAIERAERDVDRTIDFLIYAKDIARHHHERWDGKGYPDGLAGDAIPLAARLMALADVYDALASRRVYKDALPLDQVAEMIIAERGRHLDPDVVDAFVARRSDFEAIAGYYVDHPATETIKTVALEGLLGHDIG